MMICNAGFGYYGTLEDTPPDIMQRMMDVNFMGTFYGARAALPVFRAQHSGHLIFVSSIVGRRGIPFMGGYSATRRRRPGSPSRCARNSPAPASTSACVFPVSTHTEFRDAMERDFGHRCPGSARSRRSNVVARAIVDVHPPAAARGVSRTRTSRLLAIVNASRRGSPTGSCASTADDATRRRHHGSSR